MNCTIFKKISILFVLVALLATGCVVPDPATDAGDDEAASSYPEEPITLVIQASAGGGSDLFARTFVNAVETHSLLPVSVVPENRPGASGAIAFAYVAERAGDPYLMLNASGSFITTPILGAGEEAGNVNYTNFTPIANLAFDEFLVAVKADSEFETIQDVVDAAVETPDGVLAGGTQLGSSDSICFHLIEKATGADFNYIVFDGGDEVNVALLGGNVDVAIGNPGDFIELYEAGEVRLLGSFSDERLSSLPDVPTLKEQGLDLTYVQNRGFVAAADVSDEVIQVLDQAIQGYMQTDEWNDYITSKSLSSAYMDGTEFESFLASQTEVLGEVLAEMGVLE